MPVSRLSRGVASSTVAALALLGVAGCSSDEEPEATGTTDTTEETTDDTTTDDTIEEEPTEDDPAETPDDTSVDEAPAAEGTTASWAEPYETPGELITTLEGESFTVDVYQVGVTPATKSGNFADPETNEPLIAEGDDLVFVNYVATNTSDETIPLSASLVRVTGKYADWPYMQGMDSITDFDLYDEMKVVSSAITPGGPEILEWEPGTSFSYGSNFKHQAASPITFTASLTPVDDEGELLHDDNEEVTADTEIT